MLKKIGWIVGYIGLFFISLFLFMYLTFPYKLLSKRIALEITKASDFEVSIKELSPSFFTSFHLENIEIYHKKDPTTPIVIDSLQIGFSFFKLLVGNLGIDFILKMKKGTISGDLNGQLHPFAKKSPPVVPDNIDIKFKQFNIGPLSNFGIDFLKQKLKENESANLLAGPLIENVTLKSKLNGKIRLQPNLEDFTKTSGNISLKFTDTSLLDLGSESLKIPDQKFTQAQLLCKIDKGELNIGEKSALTSNEVDLKPSGKILLQNVFRLSRLNLALKIKLSGQIDQNFGFILGPLFNLQKQADGSMQLFIKGTIAHPRASSY